MEDNVIEEVVEEGGNTYKIIKELDEGGNVIREIKYAISNTSDEESPKKDTASKPSDEKILSQILLNQAIIMMQLQEK